jgi:hypothetical protein
MKAGLGCGLKGVTANIKVIRSAQDSLDNLYWLLLSSTQPLQTVILSAAKDLDVCVYLYG